MIFAEEAKREGYTVIAVAHRGETEESIERAADSGSGSRDVIDSAGPWADLPVRHIELVMVVAKPALTVRFGNATKLSWA